MVSPHSLLSAHPKMPFSTAGIEVFFYTMAATAFLLAIVYILRRRRANFHYQAAHNLDEEEVSFGTEMSKRSGTASTRTQQKEQKERDELFEDDHSIERVDDIEFDRDELDQLRMLSAVRAANDKAITKSAAALIDDSDDSDDEYEEKRDVIIDMPTRLPVSQPTQPALPSPHRLQHRQSASMQHSGGGTQADRAGKDEEKEERKEAEVSTISRSDRHERAVV